MATITARKWPFIVIGIWVILILGLGLWWLYLIVLLGHHLRQIQAFSPHSFKSIDFLYMVKWEGLTFITLLFLVSFFLLFFYLQDIKKAKWMQGFFASVTHELKTPLASIRLQAEVMNEMMESDSFSLPTFSDLMGRLLEDTQTLEMELEKILQLSIVERGEGLPSTSLNLEEYLQNFFRKHMKKNLNKDLKVEFIGESPYPDILADEFALSLILRNLLENTLKHRPQEKSDQPIKVNIGRRGKGEVSLLYDDQGGAFTGDAQRLGHLFYKHRSPFKSGGGTTQTGTGIGLYLIKKLMSKMNGELRIQTQPHLTFTLIFPEAYPEAYSDA